MIFALAATMLYLSNRSGLRASCLHHPINIFSLFVKFTPYTFPSDSKIKSVNRSKSLCISEGSWKSSTLLWALVAYCRPPATSTSWRPSTLRSFPAVARTQYVLYKTLRTPHNAMQDLPTGLSSQIHAST